MAHAFRAAAVGVVAAALGVVSMVAAQAPASPGLIPPSLERGRHLLQAQCAACHTERAPRDIFGPEAPTLLTLKRRYSRSQLEARLKEIRENGHYDRPVDVYAMPAVDLQDQDFRDIAAYIHSLKLTR